MSTGKVKWFNITASYVEFAHAVQPGKGENHLAYTPGGCGAAT